MALRYVIAVIRVSALEAVERRLTDIGVQGFTVVKVKGLGKHPSYFNRDPLSEEAKIEIVADEDRVESITRAIFDAASTGDPGDGIISVLPVAEFYRIRTRSAASPEDA